MKADKIIELYKELCGKSEKVDIDLHFSKTKQKHSIKFLSTGKSGKTEETEVSSIDPDTFETEIFPVLYQAFLEKNKDTDVFLEVLGKENLLCYVTERSNNATFCCDHVTESMENFITETERKKDEAKGKKEKKELQAISEEERDQALENIREHNISIQDLIDPETKKIDLNRVDDIIAKHIDDYLTSVLVKGEKRLDLDVLGKIVDRKMDDKLIRGLKTEDIEDKETGKIDLDRAKRFADHVLKINTMDAEVPLQEQIDQVTGITDTEESLAHHEEREKELAKVFATGKLDLDLCNKIVNARMEEILRRGVTESDLIDSETHKINLNRVESLAERIVREKSVGENVPILEVIEEVTGIKSTKEDDEKAASESYARRALEYNELFSNGKLDLDSVQRIADDELREILKRGITERDLMDKEGKKINLDRVESFADFVAREYTKEQGNEVIPILEAIEQNTGIRQTEEHDQKSREKSYDERLLEYEAIFSGNKIDLDMVDNLVQEKMQAIFEKGLEEKDFLDKSGKIDLDLVAKFTEHIVQNDDTVKAVEEASEYVEKYTRDIREAKNIASSNAVSKNSDELSEDAKKRLEEESRTLKDLMDKQTSYRDEKFRNVVSRMVHIISNHTEELQKDDDKDFSDKLLEQILDFEPLEKEVKPVVSEEENKKTQTETSQKENTVDNLLNAIKASYATETPTSIVVDKNSQKENAFLIAITTENTKPIYFTFTKKDFYQDILMRLLSEIYDYNNETIQSDGVKKLETEYADEEKYSLNLFTESGNTFTICDDDLGLLTSVESYLTMEKEEEKAPRR